MDIDHPLIKILYSSEQATTQLAPLTEEQAANPKEFGVLDNFRLRILPVVGTMPAIMGQAIASYGLCYLVRDDKLALRLYMNMHSLFLTGINTLPNNAGQQNVQSPHGRAAREKC